MIELHLLVGIVTWIFYDKHEYLKQEASIIFISAQIIGLVRINSLKATNIFPIKILFDTPCNNPRKYLSKTNNVHMFLVLSFDILQLIIKNDPFKLMCTS
ncbi:hypothetical protein CDL12_09287 [Handroanthus impetiginosus]|uniref:Uncharacterized protein n=1 Tax=Handroanthus impetiginosus TaxID=429701 RepID=A0A2G9HKH1_9LAMI|nr:hypothetical protein CDL12_09287 [Handroanthus impetiginosus]